MSEADEHLADTQAQALIDAINARRDEARKRILNEARKEARGITRQAHRSARQRFHEAAEALRRDRAKRMDQAKAQRDTELRQRHQSALSDIVKKAWPKLTESLKTRWQSAEDRETWAKGALDSAAFRLQRKGWRVVYPADSDDDFRDKLKNWLDEKEVEDAETEASDEIAAGLRIEADGATLDATPSALLAQAGRVQAALIAEIERLAESQASENGKQEAAHG
jgi:vacuolar-type H+-ATPase subunit E/Vma4